MDVVWTTTTNSPATVDLPMLPPSQTWVVIPDFPCLIKAFFAAEAVKPPSQRSRACMIACHCPSCTPQC